MVRRILQASLWLLIFAAELTRCFALFVGATAFLAVHRLDREVRQVRVTAQAEHPQLKQRLPNGNGRASIPLF